MALIEFYGVSKRFILHHERPRSFQEAFVNLFHRQGAREEFWALRDISFAIDEGESVAIIGPNGSGKSTTLKLVSRILQPTRGKVIVSKRVSALLELGAGFHPELTGRENVYLNGSLLGFGRAEMGRHFDDIVEFAELQKFIDTPIKHYSTGMVMRLGFAVAIFTDPDILITDEVLAVGDEAFQRKCIDRIWGFRREGRTIIFVSHNLASVRSLCNRAIWLQNGEYVADGPAGDVIDRYIARAYQKADAKKATATSAPVGGNRWGSGEAVITDVSFLDRDRRRREVFETGETMTVRVEFVANERIDNPQFGVAIHRSDGLHITGPNNVAHGVEVPSVLGRGFFEYSIPCLPLLQGTYEFTAAIYDHAATHPYDHHQRMYTFHVWNSQPREREGHVAISAQWTIESEVGVTERVS